MNINVFKKYNVHLCNEYSYVSDEECGERTYEREKEEWTKKVEGGELANIIAKLLLDTEFITVEEEHSKELNTLYITLFNPCDGTGSEVLIEYEELPESL